MRWLGKNQMVKFYPGLGRDFLERDRLEPLLEHERAQRRVTHELTGKGERESRRTSVERLDLADVSEQRSGEYQVRIGPQHARRVAGDTSHLGRVQEETSDRGVSEGKGGGKSLEIEAELIVGKEEVDRASPRSRADLGTRSIDPVPKHLRRDADAGKELLGTDKRVGKDAKGCGQAHLSPTVIRANLANDLNYSTALRSRGPIELLTPDRRRSDASSRVAEREDDERIAAGESSFISLEDQELMLHTIARRGSCQIERRRRH